MTASSRLLTDATPRLRNDRILGYVGVGKRDGVPIFHFHGNDTSRSEVLTVAAAAERLGVHLIGLDRPGIGRSEAKTGYRLLDWPADVVEVADQLDLERFAVEGLSGGAPYALACAYTIPQRLTACGLISPATGPFLRQAGAPSLRTAVWMVVHLPWLVEMLMCLSVRLTGADAASIDKKLLRAWLGTADQKVLATPEIRTAFAQAAAESYRQGADASTKDGLISARPWGFPVEAITFEQVFLWQGAKDRVMPVAAARLLAAALPHCTATFSPEEGHLSTFVNHVQDIWVALNSSR
jgi:pimeloyl-ACP methyl ester carboxylesterase